MTPALEFEQVTKDFSPGLGQPRLRALDGVSFQVATGEIVGIFGDNGSGKSTLLKTAAGLLRPTAGRCRIFGLDATNPAARARIGFQPESPGFPDHLSGIEVLRFYAGLSGLVGTLAKARAERVLDQTGLASAATRPVRHYTQGMRQRLGFAQALVHEPSLLLLDEPTAGVDPQGVADLAALLRQMKAAGRSVLLSSHLIDQAGEVCDRIVILVAGRMVYSGSRAEAGNGANSRESFTTEPMDDQSRSELAGWLQARGHTLQGYGNWRPGLEQLYLEKTRGSPRPGGRG
jgi:ABC-2 type transport system ATP-binding protein